MADRTLTVRGVADAVLERLRSRAAANRRSLNGELLAILDRAAADVDPAGHATATGHAPVTEHAIATGHAPVTGHAIATGHAPASTAPAPGEMHPPPASVREPVVAPYGDATQTAAASIADIDREALGDVCRRHHIVWLAVFGSFARGDALPDSDVDVVVDFAPGMTPGFDIVHVADALRPALGGRRVDLVTRRGLSSRMREPVLSSAKTLYAAE